MSEYTVAEFRDNIRKALNEIDAGGKVTITRYEKSYRLLSTDLKTVRRSGIKVVTLENKKSEPFVGVDPIPAPPVAKNISRYSNGLCKIHGIPLTDRGTCLQKDCKYA